jgi:DNA (cytosine-5)-methyltransferase 1
MGYPKGFKPYRSDGPAYKQFGNSVVVPVVEAIAESVLKTLNKYEFDGEQVTLR